MRKNQTIRRGEVYWVNLDPTVGTEVNKVRPAVIISNDAQNAVGSRVIVAPITSNVSKIYPFEAAINIKDKSAKVMLDQIRTVDARRLGEKIDCTTAEEMRNIERAVKISLQPSN